MNSLYILCKQEEQQQPFYGPLSGTTWVSQYQKKHSPTHNYLDHQPSFVSFLHLLWSTASPLFTLRAWQFLHNLSPSPLWSTSWSGTLHFILHSFLHQVIVFFSPHMPIPLQPVCCSTEIMSSIPSLSLSVNSLLGTLYLFPQHHTSIWPFSSLPTEVPPHFLFLGPVAPSSVNCTVSNFTLLLLADVARELYLIGRRNRLTDG